MTLGFPEPDPPAHVSHNDNLWQTFNSMGNGFKAQLIRASDGMHVWVNRVSENDYRDFYVAPEIIQELQAHGLVKAKHSTLPEPMAEEDYELTEEGRHLHTKLKNKPSEQRKEDFLSWIRERKRTSLS